MPRQIRMLAAQRAAETLVDRLNIRSVPVDVNHVAAMLGLRVVYHELGPDISGVLVTRDGTAPVCVVRESDAPVRQRFTIAHEIGHFHLRHQLEPGEHVHVDEGWKVSARSNKRSTGVSAAEVEANQFAAALLMPAKLLRQRAARFDIAQLDDAHVSELAREFKVSEQAMTIRIAALGL